MGKIKAVIFDWDGVLVPVRVDLRVVFDYITKKIAECGVTFDIRGDTFTTIEELIKTAKKDFEGRDTPKSFFDELQKEVLVLINEIFTQDSKTNLLGKEVLQVLRQIRELGLKTGIFTINRFHIVDRILENSNATHFFDAIVTQDDVFLDFEKIDKKDHLEICLDRLQVSGYECVVVGDRPIDILPAYKMNAITVGIITPENRNKMNSINDKINYKINSISDLYQLITALVGRHNTKTLS